MIALHVEVVRDQVIPDLVEEEARALREAHEVAAVVVANAVEERDRAAVDRQHEALAERDADPLQIEVVAALPVARDDQVQVAVVAAVLGRRLVAQREVHDVFADQTQRRQHAGAPPPDRRRRGRSRRSVPSAIDAAACCERDGRLAPALEVELEATTAQRTVSVMLDSRAHSVMALMTDGTSGRARRRRRRSRITRAPLPRSRARSPAPPAADPPRDGSCTSTARTPQTRRSRRVVSGTRL